MFEKADKIKFEFTSSAIHVPCFGLFLHHFRFFQGLLDFPSFSRDHL